MCAGIGEAHISVGVQRSNCTWGVSEDFPEMNLPCAELDVSDTEKQHEVFRETNN